ncbi:6-O-methylguanine DNA methyltransferase [Endozoicomonas sp. OPT23]|uniref:methylated-DNA--[protein]-cysteine S-methyltransferase n=1 Tax=Endozoicomonas sp. OPT23 TaxID=2072845 RepID=UPI00129A142E|nr:methylated-DNA--[protein]-cysteine S-methyltransferase [Endozoicomonas sp. OPT23]MRI33832.1 6-O-methylguanine DNA methyltransferase [Endozoicomonas sp. OPT23]
MPDFPDKQHYQYVAKAIAYIRSHANQQPSLQEVAEVVGVSEYHLQRIFKQWAGVSPKRFLQFLTKERALQALRESGDILQASLEAGLSGPGRLHDLMISCEAMTPGEVKSLGENLVISYGFAESPFGRVFLGWTDRGICHLSFIDGQLYDDEPRHEVRIVDELQKRWSKACLQKNTEGVRQLAARIFQSGKAGEKVHLLIQGTNFQLKVWEALLATEPGQLLSYSQLADMAGSPKAQRAVGSALAKNNIGWLIPCHRVIRETGEFGNYRWGVSRKAAIQGWEVVTGRGGERPKYIIH